MVEESTGSKVTQRDLYEAINENRREMGEGFDSLRTEMRGTYAVSAVCEQRHEGVNAAIEALANASKAALEDAVTASKDDRDKLWAAMHDVQTQLKWAASIVIVAFLGVIGYLIQSHLR